MSNTESDEVFERGATFATATIARIYLDQGKLDEAERIYRQLLERAPLDPLLGAALEEIERRRGATPDSDVADSVILELGVPDDRVSCRYRVSSAGLARAEMVTSSSGKLVLRLTTFPVDPDTPALDTALDVDQAADGGELTLDLAEGALLAAAAVGLLANDGQFTSIAHSKILQVRS